MCLRLHHDKKNRCRWCNFWPAISAFYGSCCDGAREILENAKLCICYFVSVLFCPLKMLKYDRNMNYANMFHNIPAKLGFERSV